MTGPGSGAPSLVHLLGRLEVVGRRVGAAVGWRRASDPDPADRFRGLHISPAHVDALLAGHPVPAPASPEAAALHDQVEALADAEEAAGADLRLRRLARTFGLGELEVELLLIALAPDLDSRFERLYGYLHDDVSRRRASVGLWLELCGLQPASAASWRALAPGAPLVDGRLLLVEEPERPFLTRSLRVPDRVTAFLLGEDAPDGSLRHVLVESEAEPAPAAAALARALSRRDPPRTRPPGPRSAASVDPGGGASGQDSAAQRRWIPALAYVRERPGTSAAALGAAALREAGLGVLALDLRRVRQ
ncbi:MAG TPA: hypothetical protein VGO86_16700, partial [Candidatus Dormibacteraeota bacterium]